MDYEELGCISTGEQCFTGLDIRNPTEAEIDAADKFAGMSGVLALLFDWTDSRSN